MLSQTVASTSIILLSICPLFASQELKRADLETARQNKVVTAVRTMAPIKLDGILDEPDWERADPATDFVQQNPYEGQPATEKSEVRILYDDQAIYIGVYFYDSEPHKIILNTLEEDFNPTSGDGICIYLDTFDDDRNGYDFCTNPGGAKNELQFVNEGKSINTPWEDVWDVKATINEEGWFAELKIPFKSLRFPNANVQNWGINFQRRIRRRNEQSFWSPIPRRFQSFHVSLAGTLKGIEEIHAGRNLKFKPYVTTQFSKFADDDFDTTGDVGLDTKYSLTSGLTLDVTLNPDFSHVEVDEQQINLTRFSLFLPEKREFFLENAGIFLFGQTDDRPFLRGSEIIPFFSRRIGLSSRGQPVPIWGGVRLTGRVGEYSVGALNMQTRESGFEPANNFTVIRLKRNILAYSEVGALFLNRQSDEPGNFNRTFGVDANFRFWENLRINSFLLATRTPGLDREDRAGRIWVKWKTNFWEASTGYLDIGKNVNPEVGFTPRRDIRKSDSSFGLRPRPGRIRWIREFFPNARVQYIMDHENRLVTRTTNLEFQTQFQDGGSFTVGWVRNFERLDAPFFIRPEVSVTPGDYHFDRWVAEFRSDPSRAVSGSIRYETGDFWDGERKGWRLSMSFKPHYKFMMSAEYNWDDVRLAGGDFVTRLLNMRAHYSFNTSLFLNALIQYNSDLREVSSNLRFNLIHRPLSDILIVYTEQRDAFHGGLVDKSLTLKYTHLLDLF